MNTIEPSLNSAPIDPLRDRVLRMPDVKARTGLSRSSIYAYIKDGKFPQHIAFVLLTARPARLHLRRAAQPQLSAIVCFQRLKLRVLGHHYLPHGRACLWFLGS